MAKSRAHNKGGYRLGPGMTGALFKMALSLPPEPRKPPKIVKRMGKPTIPDEVILEMRRLHEVERKTTTQVIQMYPNMRTEYVRQVLEYSIRSNIPIPKTQKTL